MAAPSVPVRGGSCRLAGLVLGLAVAFGLAAPAFAQQGSTPVPSLRPIGDLNVDTDGDFVPDLLGTRVTVSGHVTVGSQTVRADRRDVFMQDATGGILLGELPSGPLIVVGDSLLATGTVIHRNGHTRVAVDTYRILAAPIRPVEPRDVDLEKADLEALESQLIRVEGYVAGKGQVEAGSYFNLIDGSATLVVFAFHDSTDPISLDAFTMGDYVRVTGLLGQYDRSPPYDGSYQLYPRTAADLATVGLPPRFYRRAAGIAAILVLLGTVWLVALQREVRRQLRQLRRSEARYEALIENTGDAVFVHAPSPNAPLLDVNPAACQLLGVSREGLLSRSWVTLVAPEDRAVAERHLEAVGLYHEACHEITLCTRQGVPILFEISSNQVDLDDRPVILSMARDVTQRKAYEQGLIEARQEAERLADLRRQFLTNMSHEIRTPLSGIIGFAELMQDELDDAEMREFAVLIAQSAERLLDTLHAILELARLDADQVIVSPQDIDAEEEVRLTLDLLRPLADRKGLALRFETADAPLPARTDPAFLHRIVTNLVGNGIKFTEQGSVRVRLEADDDALVLTVQDTGIGISPAFLPHLFDEFNQESAGLDRTHEGSGLGLTITKRLVDRLGGQIDVDSRRGEGVTFTVTLPRLMAGDVTEAAGDGAAPRSMPAPPTDR